MPDRHVNKVTFLLTYAFILIRFCAFGFSYFYQLDDYIQYHNLKSMYGSTANVVKAVGLLGARPLAGIFDAAIWSRFFNHMFLTVVILSFLYAFGIFLLYKIFNDLFRTGKLFLIISAIMPLSFEGTYWISASSRIIPGLFFSALSAFLFVKFCKGGKKLLILPVLFFQLISCGFYEQAACFSTALLLMIGIIFYKKTKQSLFSLCSFVNLGLYFVITSTFSRNSVYSGRTTIILPFSKEYFDTFLPTLLVQLKKAFIEGGYYTLVKGFLRGISIIKSEKLYVYLILSIILCIIFYIVAKADKSEESTSLHALWIGFLLAAAPIAPFFIIGGTTWFSLRGTVLSLPGLALIADTLLRLFKKKFYVILTVVLTFLCLTAGVSEIYDYKTTYENGKRIGQAVLTSFIGKNIEGRIAILNLNPSYLPDCNYRYHEHIHGATESGWAFTGLLRCMARRNNILWVEPISVGIMYENWNREDRQLDIFDTVFWYDGEQSFIVNVKQTGPTNYEIYNNNKLIAAVSEDKGIGYLWKIN